MTNNTGLLDQACCYLSGPMEFVKDNGVEWRLKFKKLTKDAGLKLDCIDPTDKPGNTDLKLGEDKSYQEQLQQQGKWIALKEYVAAYRRYDLRFVDYSDFLVAVIDKTVPQWGTSNEIYEAERQHKPIFFICDGGLFNLPRWLFDVVDLDDPAKNTRLNVFASVEDVVEELLKLNSGTLPFNKKWVLVRKHLELLRSES